MRFSWLFAQNVAFFMKPTFIQVLIKKTMLETRIKQIFLFKSRGSVLYFHVLYVQIFIQQNILGEILVKNIKNAGGGWQSFSKTLAGKELIWNDTGYSEHALWAQYNSWQDRKISFYWHMAWQHLIWPQFTDVLLKLLVTCTVSALICLAPGEVCIWKVSCLMWS